MNDKRKNQEGALNLLDKAVTFAKYLIYLVRKMKRHAKPAGSFGRVTMSKIERVLPRFITRLWIRTTKLTHSQHTPPSISRKEHNIHYKHR